MHALLAVDHVHRIAVELRAHVAVVIDDRHRQAHRGAVARRVVHLGIHSHVRRLLRDIEVRGMDVDALALEAVVERQRLVDLAHHVQPHVPVDAAVVGIEVVRVPLEPGGTQA